MLAPKRVVILGTSSSGKTTLAKKNAAEQGIQRIELDQLYWQLGAYANARVFTED